MSIRRKLFFFLLFITGILALMGSFLILGGTNFVTAFKNSLEAMDSLNSIRELKTNIIRQRASLNRYILVEEPQELLSYEEATTALKSLFEEIRKNNPESEWLTNLETFFPEIEKESQHIVNLLKRNEKQKAIDEASTRLFPKFSNLIALIETLEKEKATEAQRTYKTSKELSQTAGVAVFSVVAFGFIMGTILLRSLYRSLMKPLEKLKKGTEEFGKGQWDHKIELSSDNEFGALAKSFNQMAENVKQLQQQAIHMDRMSAVGQLAGGVAHELNNPLTGVLGQAQILIAKTTETDPVFQQLKKIEQAALRCKKIVRGLLDFSRPSQTKFEEVNPNDLLESTMDLCEADLKSAKVNLNKKLTKPLPPVEGNPSELQQVMLNLISNAIHAMAHGGGTLTLETIFYHRALTFVDRRKGVPPQEVTGQWVEIIVRDTGVGISKEHITHIFEPFFTTKEIGQGTGLGLSVSMGIARKHGGNINVSSQGMNRGSSFHLILPAKGNPGHYMGGDRIQKEIA